MPKLNLFLSADVEIEAHKIKFNDSLLAPVPSLRTKAQRHALHCILSNVGKYKGQTILFSLRNQANEPPQYNPHGYGQKPLIAVIKQLQKNGLLGLQKGKAWFSTNEQGEDEDRRLSQFKASDQLIKICEDLGYTTEATQRNSEGFVELRTVKSKKRITYTETPYSTYTNELMSEYCEFLNQYRFEVDGESLGHIHLVRKYSDWDGSGELKFGGRAWLPYMQFGSAKRSRIKIDGQPVEAVDYPASQLNVLYKHVTGEFLQSEDPYEVADAARSTVKYLVSIMLNNGSNRSASLAANNEKNLKEKLKTKAKIEQYKSDVKRFGSVSKLMTAIAKRNAPVAECFFRGKAKGQEYAWLEANLVFEVARRLARSGVPALTVHDEFIVPEGNEGLVREFMYTTESYSGSHPT
jgi:hypothetical protein